MTASSSPPRLVVDTSPSMSGCASGVLDMGWMSVGWLASPGSDAATVARGIRVAGFLGMEALSPDELVSQTACRLFVIDTAIPGAFDLVERLCRTRELCAVITLAADPAAEVASLQAGAALSLRKPICADLLAWHVTKLRDQARQNGVVRDEIECRASEARADSVQHIAAVVTHEMCSPLTVVAASAELLREQLRTDRDRGEANWDELEQLASDIESATRRVQRSVQEMRSLTRAGTRPPTRSRLADVVHEAIRETPNPRKVPISLRLASDEYALALPDLLRHVLSNLITNALHAVRTVAAPQVTVRVYALNGEARISVRDNGPGVAPELRDRIFEPFFTTKKDEGTGVGLALCRELVARMGGALTLSNGAGGACFRVRLRPA